MLEDYTVQVVYSQLRVGNSIPFNSIGLDLFPSITSLVELIVFRDNTSYTLHIEILLI